MGTHLVTESMIRSLIDKGTKTLEIKKGTIITPLASELAASHGVKIVETIPPASQTPAGLSGMESQPKSGKEAPKAGEIVVFGSDHGGFQLKEVLKGQCQAMGFKVIDVGTHSEEPCDYPDFAYAASVMVAEGKAWRGVVIDGAGIGSCVVANKVTGIRAACCHNEFVARNAREHNDTNVLTLGSRVVGSEVCKAILKTWLETCFGGGRHKSRVDKILDVEKRYLKFPQK